MTSILSRITELKGGRIPHCVCHLAGARQMAEAPAAPFIQVLLSSPGHEPTTLEAPTRFVPYPRDGRVVFSFVLPEPKPFLHEGSVDVTIAGSRMVEALQYSDEAVVLALKPKEEWLPEPWVQLNQKMADPVVVQLRLRKVDAPPAGVDVPSAGSFRPSYLVTRVVVHVKPVPKEELVVKAPEAKEPVTDLDKAIAV